MKTLLLAVTIVGTCVALFSKRRRIAGREMRERDELGRWEGEGGAPSPEPDVHQLGRT
jgi:hypothetical protein